MTFKEGLYVGCGKKEVTFRSVDPANPAKFYINSTPAYKEYATQLITTDKNADPKKYAIAKSDHYGKSNHIRRDHAPPCNPWISQIFTGKTV